MNRVDRRARSKSLVIEGLRRGMSRDLAASYASVSRSTVYRWMDADSCFRENVDAAIAHSEFVMVRAIQDIGSLKSDWRAFAWLLERRFPERWSLRRSPRWSFNLGVLECQGLDHSDIDQYQNHDWNDDEAG